MFLVVLVLLAIGVGCTAAVVYPKKGVHNFWTDDPVLEQVFTDAAQEWTDNGLVVAAQVTVNLNRNGIKLDWADRDALPKLCNHPMPAGSGIDGCAHYSSPGHFAKTLLFAREIHDSPERLRAVALHEMIHVIVPTPDHLPPGEVGIMSTDGNSPVPTEADMAFLAARTQVV